MIMYDRNLDANVQNDSRMGSVCVKDVSTLNIEVDENAIMNSDKTPTTNINIHDNTRDIKGIL